MRRIFVIGIGVGNPDQLTVQAIHALEQLDVVFVMDKGPAKEDLVGLRKLLCERYIRDKPYRIVELGDPVRDAAIDEYKTRVERWHEERVALYEHALLHELREDQCAGVLVWGDPALYDSTLRLLERLRSRATVAFDYQVFSGVTSISALAASHRIPLHRIGGALLVTTGRKLAERGLPADVDDVVVMLDGDCAFLQLPAEELEIYWGAYLGTRDEILHSGKLNEVRDEIVRIRKAARARHGWIMDTYLLRRPLS